MDIRTEVLDYIQKKESTGALLLTGPWGCGKSYLIKEIAKQQNKDKEAAVAVISLFGLDSVDAINKRVKDEYIDFKLSSMGKRLRKVSKRIATVAKDGMDVANAATKGTPGLSAASHGLSAILSYDLFGFITVRNTVGANENERNFVLVFDDLERNSLKKSDLLGVINEYVENKNIRVIIIADEDKIKSEEYSDYREKLISRTIKMSADYDSLIEGIIKNYSETIEGYALFLSNNSHLLKQVFFESNSNNLRTFKSVLADFERAYGVWKETDVPADNMKWVLYTFASEVFISKSPKKEESNENKSNSYFSHHKENEQYKDRLRNKSSFTTLQQWIYTGSWDRNQFIEELRNKYAETIDSPVDRFLKYPFWSLQKNDLNIGLPTAVNLAYSGMLSREDMITLISHIHFLKSNSITIPCEVNYVKMEEGFKKRIDGIKNRTIIEPECLSMVSAENLDPEAKNLYKMISHIHYKMIAWDYRRKLIDFFNGDSLTYQSNIEGLPIEEFDDELLSLFEEKYAKADNYNKRRYANLLTRMNYFGDTYSDENNIQKTKQNFSKLLEWLKFQITDDPITFLNDKYFADEINNEIIKHDQ